jgi:hypothetical protein
VGNPSCIFSLKPRSFCFVSSALAELGPFAAGDCVDYFIFPMPSEGADVFEQAFVHSSSFAIQQGTLA